MVSKTFLNQNRMSKKYIEDVNFKGEDFIEKGLPKGEYENCTFANCVFSNTLLTGVSFLDCTFEDSDLSMAKVDETAFKNVQFKNCKLLGVNFDDCNGFLLALEFDNCLLNFCSFYKLKLKNTVFKDCKLEEVEFVETDLTNAAFKNCDLKDAKFENTLLENADLRTSFNFSIDPEVNRVYKAQFSIHNVAGLLHKYKIKVE